MFKSVVDGSQQGGGVMKEFISCPNPACDSRMKWDKDDDEYSCGACASVLTIPEASRAQPQGEVCLCDTCTLEGQCPTLAAGIRACYCNRYCKKEVGDENA